MKTFKEPVFNHILLKDIRIKKGLTVYELARMSGIGESMLHKLENRGIVRPTFDTVASISRALDLRTDDFVLEMAL